LKFSRQKFPAQFFVSNKQSSSSSRKMFTSWVNQSRFNQNEGHVNVKDFNASGDGVTNDTAAIQRAEDYASSVKRVLYFPPGTYIVDGLYKRSYTTWVGESRYASIIKHSGKGTQALVSDQSDSVFLFDFGFRELTFDGNRDGSVDANGVPNGDTVVRATVLLDFNPIGVEGQPGYDAAPSKNFTMQHCIVKNGPYLQMPCHLKGISNILYHGNYIYDSGSGLYHCLYIRRCAFARVTENHMVGIGKIDENASPIGGNKGIKIQQCPDSLVANNTVTNCNVGIHSQDTRRVTVTSNSVTNCVVGIQTTTEQPAYGNEGLVISSNTVSECVYGIDSTGCYRITISSNMVYDCDLCEMYVRGTRFGVVTGNVLYFGKTLTQNHSMVLFPNGGENNEVLFQGNILREDAVLAVGDSYTITGFDNQKQTEQTAIWIIFSRISNGSGAPNIIQYNNCAARKLAVDQNGEITL